MNDISFEKKLEIMAKAFFRDRDGHEGWRTWRDTLTEMREGVSAAFVQTCYELNREDPELNTELVGDA
jgi:hypothetical protein